MSDDSQTTNPGPSLQLEQTPNERPATTLRELDAALAWMMGWTEIRHEQTFPAGPAMTDREWVGVPPSAPVPHTVPEFSADPAASAGLKWWLLASGRFNEITVSTYPLIGEVEVLMTAAGGGEDDRVVCNRSFGPDPVAAECEALARCVLKALTGKGADHAG
jgi:hypothetical protein